MNLHRSNLLYHYYFAVIIYDMDLEEYTMAMEVADETEAMFGKHKNMTCMSWSLRSTPWRRLDR